MNEKIRSRSVVAVLVLVAALAMPLAIPGYVTAAVAPPVVINEFMPNPVRTDKMNEWIELFNPTNQAVDLTGWTISNEDHGRASLNGRTIPAGGFLLLVGGGTGGADFRFEIRNVGDRVVLRHGETVVDEVSFGDRGGELAPAKGRSLGRSPNGQDTGTDATDFVVFTALTPGGFNGVLDNIPPTVYRTSPVAGATAVPVDTNVVVRFNEAMDTASVQGAFTISPVVTGVFSWQANAIMTFNPDANLAAGTLYTVTIGTGAKDVAGNHLTAAHTWSFTTAGEPPPPPGAPGDEGVTEVTGVLAPAIAITVPVHVPITLVPGTVSTAPGTVTVSANAAWTIQAKDRGAVTAGRMTAWASGAGAHPANPAKLAAPMSVSGAGGTVTLPTKGPILSGAGLVHAEVHHIIFSQPVAWTDAPLRGDGTTAGNPNTYRIVITFTAILP
ncbi:MAG: hypothetical protein DDT30_01014 [Dehalococcoidia bacterium]|nr:hypothetical protein [Bacillota bacterium]MBT9142939.1 hypothetical protein [Bacillota bacterium]